jgi:hypothetical protein
VTVVSNFYHKSSDFIFIRLSGAVAHEERYEEAFKRDFSRERIKGKAVKLNPNQRSIPEEASDAISLDPHSGTSVTAPSARAQDGSDDEKESENICLPPDQIANDRHSG